MEGPWGSFSLRITCLLNFVILLDSKLHNQFVNTDFDDLHDHTQDHSPEIIEFHDEDLFLERFSDNPEFVRMFENHKNGFSSEQSSDEDIPGYLGRPVVIKNPTKQMEAKIEENYKLYGYNAYVSDMIPSDRPLPDTRNEGCSTPGKILGPLLPTSVIICFYNEAHSVLLRTITSIINRSPPHLLAEILVINDFSDVEDYDSLHTQLQQFPIIKYVNLPKREGLIRCRLLGSFLAHAPILTFLDSHVEVGPGWLEPLLDIVTKNWKTIAVPVFNYIDASTFAINMTRQARQSLGGFTWYLKFAFKEATKWDLRNATSDSDSPIDPIPSPSMPGGFFSIHREFFDNLGQFDDEFEIWGGENLELSFKAWMCGGRIEINPCSQVAHLERTRSTYSREKSTRNHARLAAVWLDEYAPFYFFHGPAYRKQKELPDYGDISSRMELKKGLNCLSFDWYLRNVIPDMINPKTSLAFGEVRNLMTVSQTPKHRSICLDSHEPKEQGTLPSFLWDCHGLGGNQFWYYTALGEIRTEKKCLDYFGNNRLVLFTCHGMKGNQQWEYHGDIGIIFHPKSELCLTLEFLQSPRPRLKMEKCEGNQNQRWKFEVDRIQMDIGTKFHQSVFPLNFSSETFQEFKEDF